MMKSLVLIGLSLVLSISAEYHCACPDNYLPVCGSDGVTYPNECELNCQKQLKTGLTVDFQGRCEDKKEYHCACPDNYLPVCGSDGTTYPNECELNCQKHFNNGLTVDFQGRCEDKKEKLCICPANYSPVCGSDGVTYPNECMLNCQQTKSQGLTIAKQGECGSKKTKRSTKKNCFEVDIYAPVCASNGVTYKNSYELDCFMRDHPDVRPSYYGKCKTQQLTNLKVFGCRCSENLYDPVCGTNGHTYTNRCLFNCETTNSPTLGIAHNGPC